jgi:amino acid transporter
MGMGVWVLGGILSLVGALCYAELATTYPQLGGDYVYLTRAFGRLTGFLFGWAQLAVILTASIGAMACVFADYAIRLWGLGSGGDAAASVSWTFLFAVTAVGGLSLLNLMGVVFGKGAQNVLTVAKVLGLGGILLAGFGWGSAAGWSAPAAEAGTANFALAMILVLYTYGGWNDTAFVVAEVRDPRRNIPQALILGITGITLIYLLVNAAYIWGLGFQGARQSQAIAADILQRPLQEFGARGMSLLVMISALGAVNGMIFTGSRVYSKLGSEHRVFATLGQWDPRRGVPTWALIVQALISMSMIAVVSTRPGQALINSLLTGLGLGAVEWSGHGGFETLVTCSAPVFWTFFLLTGLSLFVLRAKDPQVERPFPVPLYPLLPLIFCGMCCYMLYSSIKYLVDVKLVGGLILLAIVPLLVGLVLYLASSRRGSETEGV